MPLNCILKMLKMANFVLLIFFHIHIQKYMWNRTAQARLDYTKNTNQNTDTTF